MLVNFWNISYISILTFPGKKFESIRRYFSRSRFSGIPKNHWHFYNRWEWKILCIQGGGGKRLITPLKFINLWPQDFTRNLQTRWQRRLKLFTTRNIFPDPRLLVRLWHTDLKRFYYYLLMANIVQLNIWHIMINVI